MNIVKVDFEKINIGTYESFGGTKQVLTLGIEDRMRHVYLIGKTGSGKTSILKNTIGQAILRGEGVCLIDPHGDLANDLFDLIPSHRLEDVIYIDPSDLEKPIGFNPFDCESDIDKSLVASSLISTFKNLWSDSWGPRMEYVLLNTILALLEVPKPVGVSILGIPKMLTDKNYREWVLTMVKDPKVKSFWEEEFAKYSERVSIEVVSPILNKVGSFLSSPVLRNILGQVKSSFSVQYAMDNSKIIIVNLSKGKIGEDRANLLGSLLVSAIQIEALKRAQIPEGERVPFYLYLDEFQNFTTEAFVSILSEARKYKLSLTIAHQYTDQIKPSIFSAVIGNVGTLMLFTLTSKDAEKFSSEFSEFPLERMIDLELGQSLVRQYKDGRICQPVKVANFKPVCISFGQKDKIMDYSKQRYCSCRKRVEGKILRFYRVRK